MTGLDGTPTVEHVIAAFKAASGIAGSVKLRKGSLVLAASATLDASSVVTGDVLATAACRRTRRPFVGLKIA